MTSPRPAYPLGAALSLETLETDPHAALAELRRREPVSWVPALQGWLVTLHAEARRLVAALRPSGSAEIRSDLAGPLAVQVVASALDLLDTDA